MDSAWFIETPALRESEVPVSELERAEKMNMRLVVIVGTIGAIVSFLVGAYGQRVADFFAR